MPRRNFIDTLLVVFGDIHCGSTRGLMPGKGIVDVDGNPVLPNKLQKIINEQWNECWGEVGKRRKGKRLAVVCLGDTVEGVHHGTTQIVSQRIETHEEIATDCIDGGLQKAKFTDGDLLWFVAGTDAHVGRGSQSDERVAKDFDCAIQDKDNSRHTWEALQVDINGVLFDFAHQGASPGRRYHTKENSLRYALRSMASQCLDMKEDIPDYVYSAHHHTLVQSGSVHGYNYVIEGCIIPSFQFKTGYAIKLFNHKPSDIGLVIQDISVSGVAGDITPLMMRYIQTKRMKV